MTIIEQVNAKYAGKFYLARSSDKTGDLMRVSRRTFATLDDATKAAMKVDAGKPKQFTYVWAD